MRTAGKVHAWFLARPMWARVLIVVVGVPVGLAILTAPFAPAEPERTQVEAAGPETAPSTAPETSTSSSTVVTTTSTSSTTSTTTPPTTAPVGTTRTTAPTPTVAATNTSVAALVSGCHPSYSGACVPSGVSDVDCAGGGGNGPAYVSAKGFRVVGRDVYDLDRNGDGIACES